MNIAMKRNRAITQTLCCVQYACERWEESGKGNGIYV